MFSKRIGYNSEKPLEIRCTIVLRTKMPRTINGENSRKGIRVPALMIEEIDRIVEEFPELHYNRQQFVECAIREKIKRTQTIEGNNSKNRSS